MLIEGFKRENLWQTEGWLHVRVRGNIKACIGVSLFRDLCSRSL